VASRVSTALPPPRVSGAPRGDSPTRGQGRRRRKLLVLAGLLLLLGGLLAVWYYLAARPPLTTLPAVGPLARAAPPRFLFAIYGVARPVAVALSADQQRLYVAESEGERLVRIFDRSGQPLGMLAPPRAGCRRRRSCRPGAGGGRSPKRRLDL